MNWKNLRPRTRLRIVGGVILLIGLVSAVVVYVLADRAADNAVGYDMVDGQAYAVSPGSSKRYIHDLEMYGGKAAVMADELNRWFAGLWQGTSLAYTIGIIAATASFGFFFVAARIEGDEDGQDDGS